MNELDGRKKIVRPLSRFALEQ